MADILSVLRVLEQDELTRQRCAGLSSLVADLPEKERRDHCEAMASVYFDAHEPPAEELLQPSLPERYQGQLAFVSSCCPPPRSKWERYVRADYNKKGRPTRATMSPGVAGILTALESLWGVSGHLVLKR